MARVTSIRTKLYALVPATLVAVGIAVGLGLYVQSRYGIGGAIYEQMAVQKEFLSEVEPAVLVPTLGYIAILELETEKDPVVIARTVQQYRAAEANFRAAREKRLRQAPGGRSTPPPRARPHRAGRGDVSRSPTPSTFHSSSEPAARSPSIRTRSPACCGRSRRHFHADQAGRRTGCSP